MEERGNKTIMCSVLFLDIVEYSRRSVAGQISLKERFNSYLSAAISSVPITDRIILDTGDGAAINFLGDVEDALKAALSLRESILNEDASIDPPLLVRAGVNLGPVRLVRDINGQPNIVGDGINVAQRVMGFAEVGQILVSRSYHDAVSRLSPQYAEIFHYQGSRTDKHVRDHEVYAVGHPGEKTSELVAANLLAVEEAKSPRHTLAPVSIAWGNAASRLNGVIERVVLQFKQAEPKQRVLYLAAVGIPLVLIIGLTVKLTHRNEAVVNPDLADMQIASAVQPVSAVPEVFPAPVSAPAVSIGTAEVKPLPAKPTTPSKPTTPTTSPKPDTKMVAESKGAKDKAKHQEAEPQANDLQADLLDKIKAKKSTAQPKTQTQDTTASATASATANTTSGGGSERQATAYVSVTCVKGTELFVDGVEKGKINGMLKVAVPPGKHLVIVTHPSKGLFSQKIEPVSGATAHIKPGFCD